MFQVEHIVKSFGSIRACDDVSLVVRPGEIVALLGENGAGKSTLLAIMGGYLQPDGGNLVLEGVSLKLGSPRQAMQAGIGLVHQHLSLVPTFTVEEQLRLCGWNGDPLPAVMSDLDLKAPISSLAMGIRQRLEVAKALLAHPTVLLLDEPTSILAPTEVGSLLEMLRDLRTSGLGIVLVTHKLPEVLDVADRIVVLRHGAVRGRFDRAANGDWPPNVEATTLSLMFGLDEVAPAAIERSASPVGGRALLQIEDLSVSIQGQAHIDNVNLTVRAGEIVSVVGMDGQGQRELALAVAGYVPAYGNIRLADQELSRRSALGRAKAGIGLLVDDRLGEAAVGSMTLTENVAMKHPRPESEARRGIMRWSTVRDRTSTILQSWSVTPNDPDRSFATLSGGNMQKLLTGRELDRAPRVLLALNPMQGLDWQTVSLMWSRFRQHCESGGAVLLFTGDLDEAMSHSDLVAAISSGRLGDPAPVAVIDRQQLTRQMVGEW